MRETVSLFTTAFNHSLSVEARPEHLSSDAGAVLLREILEHSGLVEHLTAKLTDPRDPRLITHRSPISCARASFSSAKVGATRTTPTPCVTILHCGWPSPAIAAPPPR